MSEGNGFAAEAWCSVCEASPRRLRGTFLKGSTPDLALNQSEITAIRLVAFQPGFTLQKPSTRLQPLATGCPVSGLFVSIFFTDLER